MTQATYDLLLSCLRARHDPHATSDLGQLTPAEWADLYRLASRHGLAALVYASLVGNDLPGTLPLHLAARLRNSALHTARHNLDIFQRLQPLTQALAQAGIPTIGLKGIYLAQAVYPDVSLRIMRDIDLLVPRAHLQRAESLLFEQGYRYYRQVKAQPLEHKQHLPPFVRPGDPPLELHWTIADPRGPAQIDLGSLWVRARPAQIEGLPLLALAPADLLTHLCLHLAQHGFQHDLRHLCDIDESLRRFQSELDWGAFTQQAQDWGVTKPLHLALLLSRRLLGTPVPEPALAALRPPGFEPRIADQAQKRLLSNPGVFEYHPDLVALWSTAPLQRRLSPLLHGLFPPRQHIALQYDLPVRSVRVYLVYPLRIASLVRRYAAQLWHTILRQPGAWGTTQDENALNNWLATP